MARDAVECAILLGSTRCPTCRGEGTVPLNLPHHEDLLDAYGQRHVATTMHNRAICGACNGRGIADMVCPECQCCTFLPPDARGFMRCKGCGWPSQ